MEITQFFGGQEGSACIGGFTAIHTVQLGGMTARFVHLQCQLRAPQDERGGDVGRAGISGEQGDRLSWQRAVRCRAGPSLTALPSHPSPAGGRRH